MGVFQRSGLQMEMPKCTPRPIHQLRCIPTYVGTYLPTYILESAHISAMAYCIKLEVDISMRRIFGLNKNGLGGNTIWHKPRKVSEISHENKARAWTKIKNHFMRLTGMKKLIFHLSNFFGSGHFLIHEILKNRPKYDRSQKRTWAISSEVDKSRYRRTSNQLCAS